MKLSSAPLAAVFGLLLASQPITSPAAAVQGWLSWRGPNQNGTSAEKGLPDKIDVKEALWTADFPGASTPVIANGRLYIMGYLGDGPELQEGVGVVWLELGSGRK